MSDAWKYRLGSAAGRRVIEAVLGTCRFEVEGADRFRRYQEAGGGVIFTLWHGRQLPLTYHHRNQGIVAIISRSGDGEYIARIVEAWGYGAARGSSHRGGSEALRDLVKHARKGRSLAVTPDGPRGPRQKLKMGAVVAAQLTGLPMVPMAGAATRGWWFGGWDRFLVPKPFSTIHVAYGEPHEVPRNAAPEELERIAASMEAELNRVTDHVDRIARQR